MYGQIWKLLLRTSATQQSGDNVKVWQELRKASLWLITEVNTNDNNYDNNYNISNIDYE